MTRVLAYLALVASALVLQLCVLDTLPLPGAAAPDLMLLVVVAVALTSGTLPGTITGFAAGLAMDLAPPASHTVGEYALVFCLVGYVCGRAAGEIDRSAFLPLGAMALGAIGGSALYTAVGVTFGEADVTWAAARHVLPASIAYDLILSPFVLYVVMRLVRLAGKPAEEPAAALARASAGARPVTARPGTPRQPRIGSAASRGPSMIGSGVTSAMAAVAGRSAGAWGMSQGGRGGSAAHGRSLPGGRPPSVPRMRFGSSKLPGPGAAARQGVFSGGSLTGTPAVRLRLGNGHHSWLRSLTARTFGLAPRPRQPAQPRFTAVKPSTGLRQPGAAGSRRGPAARLGRTPGIRFGGGPSARLGRHPEPGHSRGPKIGGRPGLVGGRPRFGGGSSLGGGSGVASPPRMAGRPALGRTPRFGRGPKFGRRPALGRTSVLGRGPSFGRGPGTALRRFAGWLPTLRPRRRRPEVWRTSGNRRTGGSR